MRRALRVSSIVISEYETIDACNFMERQVAVVIHELWLELGAQCTNLCTQLRDLRHIIRTVTLSNELCELLLAGIRFGFACIRAWRVQVATVSFDLA